MSHSNLLFLYADEQAYDTLSCYGNGWIEMPNLNALAGESTVFDRAYITQPVCTPSRSTLLTGQWPHTNGCVANNIPLGARTRCLPEILPGGSYVTGHFGKWHLGDEIFRQHGFDEWSNYEDNYIEYYGEGRERTARSDYHHYLVGKGFTPDRMEKNLFSREATARLPEDHGKPSYIAGRAADFIRRHAAHPFALYVNFLEPHMPFFGPRDGQYDPGSIPLPPNLEAFAGNDMPEKYERKSTDPPQCWIPEYPVRSEEGWRALRARYYGLCSLIDTHIGRILQTLRDTGHWDDTVIVFTSDHGDMMGAHGQTAKGVMYEEAIRVPLLVKLPGQRVMKRVEGPMSHIDLMPTILDLMGFDVPDDLQGRSLKRIMESAGPRLGDDVFLEWHNSGPDGSAGVEGEHEPERAIVTADSWKFVWEAGGKHILFDLNRDPKETVNLYGREEHGRLVESCMGRIRDWQARTGDPLPI